MKKIVLFNPIPSINNNFNGLPLALLAISRQLDKKRYNIKIIAAYSDNHYKENVIKEMRNSLCLGVTAMTSYQILDAIDVCKMVKEVYPDKKIIWGGWHPSLFPYQTLQNDNIDIVCVGQGEITFKKVVEAIDKGHDLKNINGIYYKKNGKIIANNSRKHKHINNFAEFPFDLIDVKKHFLSSDMGSKTLNYMSSYGCPFNCAFCAEAVVNKRYWNGLKADRVVADIDKLYRVYKCNAIQFNDSNFFVDEDRVRKICYGLLSKGIKIKWGYANGKASEMIKFKDSTFKLMKDSGCYSIHAGAESGCNKILQYINKNGSSQDVLGLVNRCHEYDIKIILSFIIGFPKNSRLRMIPISEEFVSTLNFIKKIISITKNVEILWFSFTPYPGTPLYHQSIKQGLKEPETLADWAKYELTNPSNVSWMPRKYSTRINFLTKYILPLILENNRELERVIQKHIIIKIGAYLIKKLAYLRYKYNYYDCPVEYYLVRILYSNLINRQVT